MNEMIYHLNDRIPFGKLLLFGLQMMLSVFVATVLIANICGMSVSGALVGAGLATLIYTVVTRGKSPMFISNSGAFAAPVMIAFAAGGYTAVGIGGIITCLVYSIFGLVFTRILVDKIYKIFPRALIGSVTAVIGINLMGFIGTYVEVHGMVNEWGMSVAIVTMLAIAAISHYSKGVLKILPFLAGTLIGYIYAIILTLTGACDIVDFSVFNGVQFVSMPDFAFAHFESVDVRALISVVIIYIAFTVSAMMECLSDHAALGGIIGIDLYEKPGIGRIFIGEGVANLASSFFGGLGACSYGEGVACVGFSQVASVRVTITAALMLASLGFIGPIQAFITSIPSCVFAGAAIILYGFIATSGIRMLREVDLNHQKNLILVSVVLSLGVSGLAIGGEVVSLSATALALVAGVILNLILKE